MNDLETLYEILANIQGREFAFGDWNTCTCGHIYGTTMGYGPLMSAEQLRIARGYGTSLDVQMVEGRRDAAETDYTRMLDLVIEANRLEPTPDRMFNDWPAVIVSDATSALAREGDISKRDVAAALIVSTIEYVEARQREEMAEVAEAEPVHAYA